MKKIGICAPFDFGGKYNSGQCVKAREVHRAFCEKYGEGNVAVLETFKNKNYAKLLIQSFMLIKNCEQIVMLPAHNGVKVFVPLFAYLNKIFKRKLHYFVVGGWLPDMVERQKYLKRPLMSFNTIFVETNSMKKMLNSLGLNNIVQNENFRNSCPVEDVKMANEKPYRLCFFSRVIKQKGVLDAIDVIDRINRDENICTFDIYGGVEESFKEEFESALSLCKSKVTYKGFIEPKNAVQTLRDYDLHIFPTRFKTEGIPGSVVDSYFAGVPVISSKWNSFGDVIIDGVTGVGYEFENLTNFEEKLRLLLENPEKINEMKLNCIKESEKYMTKNAMEKIERYFK